jgi:hypothetical protein
VATDRETITEVTEMLTEARVHVYEYRFAVKLGLPGYSSLEVSEGIQFTLHGEDRAEKAKKAGEVREKVKERVWKQLSEERAYFLANFGGDVHG